MISLIWKVKSEMLRWKMRTQRFVMNNEPWVLVIGVIAMFAIAALVVDWEIIHPVW